MRDRWLPVSMYEEVKAATAPLKDHAALSVVLAKEGGK